MITEWKPNPEYEIKPGVVGLNVKYDCLACGVRLRSALMEAGNHEHCPDCGAELVVPGIAEKLVEAERRKREEERREVLNAQRTSQSTAALTKKVASKTRRAKDLQLNRDPLREWTIYGLFIFLLLFVAAGPYLAAAINSDRSGLCSVIIGLFILGATLNFVSIRQLRAEFVCAAHLLRQLKWKGGIEEIAQAAPAGVFHQHIQDLFKIAKHDPTVSQDSLITLLYSKLMAKSKVVDVLSGVLVSLGLIGTVVGLISMTQGLNGMLDSMDASADATVLMTGLRSTMAGLGTAFYTTLVGAILGSVVLRVLNNIYTSNVDHFVSYIAGLTEVQITPRLRSQARITAQENDQ